MGTVTSKDGTRIGFERTGAGEGPPLILVDGALCYRAMGPSKKMAEQLADRFTVISYDRRARGESGNTLPYAVEREVEDLEAVIEEAGGSAHLLGFSSGAVLALEASVHGSGVGQVLMYEPPLIIDGSREPLPDDYVEQLNQFLSTDRPGDALKLFMKQVGVPGVFIAMMRFMPAWSKLKAIAPTLPYDAAVMGDTQAGRPLPAERWAAATAPTLVIAGGKSPDWMQHGTRSLADLLPQGKHRVLDGQTHMVKAKALAPLVKEHLSGTGER